MATLILFGSLNLALIHPLLGRIGDDSKACADRYGVAIEKSPDDGFIKFEKDGVRVACVFADGVCSVISYTLINTEVIMRGELGKGPRFTKDQIVRILNLNRGGSTWSQESRDSYGEKEDGIYKTSDGKLHASVSLVAVSIESIAFQQTKLAKVGASAVDKTLASFESSAGEVQSPVIKLLPDVPKPPDPLEESMKKLEDSNEKLKQNMAIQNGAMATLDLVAKRVQKRQEMRDMLVKLEALEAELAAARSPDVLKALRAKETALTAEMNKALKEYEVLEAEFKKLNPTDDLPESK